MTPENSIGLHGDGACNLKILRQSFHKLRWDKKKGACIKGRHGSGRWGCMWTALVKSKPETTEAKHLLPVGDSSFGNKIFDCVED